MTMKSRSKADTETDPLLDKAERDARAIKEGEYLTVPQQWEEVEGWHDYLVEHAESDRPVLQSLNMQWQAIQEVTGMSDAEYGRGKELRRTADSPLAALSYFIDMGFYPPPELLMGIMDAWKRYIAGAGKISLEEAFFGPPKRGIGNYAARKTSRFRLMVMRLEFDRMLREGMSRTQIAEELSERWGGTPDADSILRMMRGFKGFFAKRQEGQAEK